VSCAGSPGDRVPWMHADENVAGQVTVGIGADGRAGLAEPARDAGVPAAALRLDATAADWRETRT
jgi:hypothetical protein